MPLTEPSPARAEPPAQTEPLVLVEPLEEPLEEPAAPPGPAALLERLNAYQGAAPIGVPNPWPVEARRCRGCGREFVVRADAGTLTCPGSYCSAWLWTRGS